MTDIETKSQALATLDSRLAAGEIGGDEYERLRALLTSGLTPDQCARLGVTQTPAPGTVSGLRMGPSGGQTRMPTIVELELEPGTVLLGQWRIVRELGRGGFGAVYEAEDIKLNRTVAMKVLDPAMVAREELLARFRREVTLMRELAHERIVRVFDYREELSENLALITMEYVGGCSVRGLLALARASKEPVSIELALAIFEQTLEALAAAHARGVIHRDVTPGNILLAGGRAAELLSDPDLDPRIKLVDFGIAGLVERTELSAKSRVLGTAAYVAPEVLDPEAEITPASDVFGAGAVAYEMLTGKTPMVTGYRLLEEQRHDVPQVVADVVSSAVRPHPGARPSTIEALRSLLENRSENSQANSVSIDAQEVRARPTGNKAGLEDAREPREKREGLAVNAGDGSSGGEWLAFWRDEIAAHARKMEQTWRSASPEQHARALALTIKRLSVRAGRGVVELVRDVPNWMTRRWKTDWILVRNLAVWGIFSFCVYQAIFFMGQYLRQWRLDQYRYDFSEYLSYFVFWAVLGFSWGFGQWLSLRKILQTGKFWISSTTAAFLVIGLVSGSVQRSYFLRGYWLDLFAFVVFPGAILGASQAWQLRNAVAKWALWIPAQIITFLLLIFPWQMFWLGAVFGASHGLLLSYLKAERKARDGEEDCSLERSKGHFRTADSGQRPRRA